jgi:UDP-glucose 4-epimerase
MVAGQHFHEDVDKCGVVAVTGGCGFVGRHLVDALLDLGKKVLVVDLAEPAAEDLKPAAEYRAADLREYDHACAALRGAEIVFHLAGNASGTSSVRNPLLDFQSNALATSNVGNASIANNVKRLFYLSSAAVYGVPLACPVPEGHPTRPFLPYGASKRSGELALLSLHAALGLPVIIGRSTTIYGPGADPRSAADEVTQFIRWHLNGRVIPAVGNLAAKTRDFIHVDDVVAAALLLANRGADGEIYNVGTGIETSMSGLADLLGHVTGRMARLDSDETILDDSYRLVLDITKIAGIGFAPSIPLDAGLRLLAASLGTAPELPSVEIAFQGGQLALATRDRIRRTA